MVAEVFEVLPPLHSWLCLTLLLFLVISFANGVMEARAELQNNSPELLTI